MTYPELFYPYGRPGRRLHMVAATHGKAAEFYCNKKADQGGFVSLPDKELQFLLDGGPHRYMHGWKLCPMCKEMWLVQRVARREEVLKSSGPLGTISP